MNRAYHKGTWPKMMKIVSNFEEYAENFYSEKTVHFYNMGFHAVYSAIITLQRNRSFFLYLTYSGKK
jgi:hypothetical protein